MKKILHIIYKYLPAIPVAFILGATMFSHSCANTTEAPSGGAKDSIPPVIVALSPLPGTTNVPTHNTRIYITFNEYVKVQDPKGIFLSPPQAKSPKYRMRNKTLIVYFEEDLDTNRTYTIDLTNAISDNNEGNLYPGYTLAFSTGPTIDSMAITGTVQDCNTLQPIKGATVMLYKDHSDSAVFRHRPDAAVKTDEWGFFSMRNIQDTLYRLYAIVDESSNNIYDPDNDRIAFIDTLIRPTLVVSDTLPELLKYDMKDSANCMARNSQYELNVFKEKAGKQMIVNRARTDTRTAYVTFMAENAEIDSLWITGVPYKKLVMQFNPERDSLELWVNDRGRIPDTLHVYVDYKKTDSTGKPVPFVEHLRLTEEKTSSASKSSRRDIKHEDTTCVMKVTADGSTVEQYGFEFEFKYPLLYENFDSVTLKSINPRQQEKMMDFTVTRDTSNLRKYVLMPKEKLQVGYEYILKVPHHMFRDITGWYSDSTEVKVVLPNDDKLSTLYLRLDEVHHPYIVDLLNEKRDKILRRYDVNGDITLSFPYLSAGKYSIRITEDINGNKRVDTGSVLGHRQPEKVKFYRLKGGIYVISVPEGTEIEQQLNVAKLFER